MNDHFLLKLEQDQRLQILLFLLFILFYGGLFYLVLRFIGVLK